MDTRSVTKRLLAGFPAARAVFGGTVFLLLPVGLALLTVSATSEEKRGGKPVETWPASVQVRYRLSYNGLGVGRLDVHTETTARTYSVSGSAKVSVLLGLYTWKGWANVSGAIENGAPAPANYAFEWHQSKKKKDVAVHMGFKDRIAADVSVEPPPRPRDDTVPLKPSHKAGAFDPLSAILVLTKADGGHPCDRRAGIFDGMQRYDVVFAPKHGIRMEPLSGHGALETAHVCQVTYEPVAGHRDNADAKAYAANHDVELVLRRIPGTEMFIPYSVEIPTPWGSGAMTAVRIDIVTSAGKISVSE